MRDGRLTLPARQSRYRPDAFAYNGCCTVKTLLLMLVPLLPAAAAAGTTEFCLDGEFDLGARLQGHVPQAVEWYPARWCVVTEDESERVYFEASGKANPDYDGDWTIAFLPPDRVRIVNRDQPPDVEFHDTDNADEARRVRRLDPHRLVSEYRSSGGRLDGLALAFRGDRLSRVSMRAELPLYGAVAVDWLWDWSDAAAPRATLRLDGRPILRATGRWRTLTDEEAAMRWRATPGAEPVAVPGENWPARVDMQLANLADDVYLVTGVRTGFRHMIVDTPDGLVIADAPAGWLELHQLPATDVVPGLGVSGLSERLIDFLDAELGGRPWLAVALTHFHDDHAGGSRAFAAAGADVYAAADSSDFLDASLNRADAYADALSKAGGRANVIAVDGDTVIGRAPNRVRLIEMGPNPHVNAMLGVWAVERELFFVSDVHVPNSDASEPRPGRARTECWFARWATEHLPPSVRVINSHSAIVTPVARLERFLDSDSCQALADVATGTKH